MINEVDKSLLRRACQIARNSPDDTQVGAVLYNGKTVIGRGWNGFPVLSKCILEPKSLKRERICHGEIRALSSAAKEGYSTLHGTLYANWASCANCAKYLIDFGIYRVVTLRKTYDLSAPSWKESIDLAIEMFNEAGVIYELCSDEIGEEFLFRGELIKV